MNAESQNQNDALSSRLGPWVVTIILCGFGAYIVARARDTEDSADPAPNALRNADATDGLVRLAGETMGTTYTVKFHADAADGGDIHRLIEERLKQVNQQMSTYIADSELSLFNEQTETSWQPASPELLTVLNEAQRIGELSGGAFDVTVGPLVNLWSFGPGKRERNVPAQTQIDATRLFVGSNLLDTRAEPPAIRKLDPRVYVDLSAIAKGFGVDEVGRLLESHSISNYLIEIGGEVRTRGSKPDGSEWVVGIEKPTENERGLQFAASFGDRSMATSGNYRNFFKAEGQSFGHTIDPRTGRPVQHRLASVSVVTEDCMTADAWATTMMVLGEKESLELAKREDLAAMLIIATDDGFRVEQTAKFRQSVTVVRVDK